MTTPPPPPELRFPLPPSAGPPFRCRDHRRHLRTTGGDVTWHTGIRPPGRQTPGVLYVALRESPRRRSATLGAREQSSGAWGRRQSSHMGSPGTGVPGRPPPRERAQCDMVPADDCHTAPEGPAAPTRRGPVAALGRCSRSAHTRALFSGALQYTRHRQRGQTCCPRPTASWPVRQLSEGYSGMKARENASIGTMHKH